MLELSSKFGWVESGEEEGLLSEEMGWGCEGVGGKEARAPA